MASKETDKMTADVLARQWVTRLELREARTAGTTLANARTTVARRLGVAPGTIENLRRGRTNGVRAWLAEKIAQAVIREILSEIRGLEHELAMARQCGARAGGSEIAEIEAGLAALVAALKGVGK